jgi:hypothetical protein
LGLFLKFFVNVKIVNIRINSCYYEFKPLWISRFFLSLRKHGGFFINKKLFLYNLAVMSRAAQNNLSRNKPLTENCDSSGMPSDFGSGTTGSYLYSVYEDSIPAAMIEVTIS